MGPTKAATGHDLASVRLTVEAMRHDQTLIMRLFGLGIVFYLGGLVVLVWSFWQSYAVSLGLTLLIGVGSLLGIAAMRHVMGHYALGPRHYSSDYPSIAAQKRREMDGREFLRATHVVTNAVPHAVGPKQRAEGMAEGVAASTSGLEAAIGQGDRA